MNANDDAGGSRGCPKADSTLSIINPVLVFAQERIQEGDKCRKVQEI